MVCGIHRRCGHGEQEAAAAVLFQWLEKARGIMYGGRVEKSDSYVQG